MVNLIRSLILWLHDPNHVARIQHFFGVLPITDTKTDVQSTASKNSNNNTASKYSNGLYPRHHHHQRKVTYDKNVIDECIEEIEHSQNQNTAMKTPVSGLDYKITLWFWYYFFQIGSALGNEIFYIMFFPAWIWNVDACVARKVSIFWAFFMYIGQATKDLLAIPRPPSPPVIRIEKRYLEEYGFPSTHAMFAAGVPLLFVLLCHQRYDFNIWIGISLALLACLWVCLSRLYLGIHTILDVLFGTLYTLLLIAPIYPYIDRIYNFEMNYSFTPLFNFCLGICLMKCYPSLKQWSTARSDTTIILSSTAGMLTAGTVLNKLGLLPKSIGRSIYPMIPPDLSLCLLRTIIGLSVLFITRQIVKTLVLRLTCLYYKLDWKNPDIKRLGNIEIPYYYITYFVVGFNICGTCPLIYHALGINRDYKYTDL